MNIDRKKFLDNIYLNDGKFTIIEEALDDAEINVAEVRPLKMERVKNIYLRRFLMIILFPVYLLFAWFLTLCWMPFLYIIKSINIFIHLYNSVIKHWQLKQSGDDNE